MLRLFKYWLVVGIAGGTISTVSAFSLLGPPKAWQVTALGYMLPGDIGGPMNLTEGYRWNVPTLVYAFDQSFIAYFGKEGMSQIEDAIEILNDLPDASDITDDGSSIFIRGQRVPLDTKRVNYQAQALGLLDIKSYALNMLVEEMGLAEPERYVWTLRGRNTETIAGQTFTNYTVVKLNFDPITLQPSSYVNGALYSYRIRDPIAPQNYAEAIEFPVDPLAFNYSSVAGARGSASSVLISSGNIIISGGLSSGEFYTGLTHDDVGAIRFLLRPDNFAVETTIAGVEVDNRTRITSSPWVPFTTISNIFGNTNISFPTLPGQPGLTNAVGATNATNFIVTAIRPGLEKITFQRGNYDSLIGQTFLVFTNYFTDRYLSNGLPRSQPLQRPILQPDILFTCEDLGLAANLVPVLTSRSSTTNWINNDAVNGVTGHGGPGVIAPPVVIGFTDQLPYYENSSPSVEEDTAFSSGVWGSFDGTTNPPIIYPRFLDLTLQDLRVKAVP